MHISQSGITAPNVCYFNNLSPTGGITMLQLCHGKAARKFEGSNVIKVFLAMHLGPQVDNTVWIRQHIAYKFVK
jgi:hypothetical protein